MLIYLFGGKRFINIYGLPHRLFHLGHNSSEIEILAFLTGLVPDKAVSAMTFVWTPKKKPPHDISGFSEEAAQIWDAICQRHQIMKPNIKQKLETGLFYYQSLYNKAFKTYPLTSHTWIVTPNSISQQSQKTSDIEPSPGHSSGSRCNVLAGQQNILDKHDINKKGYYPDDKLCQNEEVAITGSVSSDEGGYLNLVRRDNKCVLVNGNFALNHDGVRASDGISPQSSELRQNNKQVDSYNGPNTAVMHPVTINPLHNMHTSYSGSVGNPDVDYMSSQQTLKTDRNLSVQTDEQKLTFNINREVHSLSTPPYSEQESYSVRSTIGCEAQTTQNVSFRSDHFPHNMDLNSHGNGDNDKMKLIDDLDSWEAESPPLDFENDAVLSQIPKLSMIVDEDGHGEDGSHAEKNSSRAGNYPGLRSIQHDKYAEMNIVENRNSVKITAVGKHQDYSSMIDHEPEKPAVNKQDSHIDEESNTNSLRPTGCSFSTHSHLINPNIDDCEVTPDAVVVTNSYKDDCTLNKLDNQQDTSQTGKSDNQGAIKNYLISLKKCKDVSQAELLSKKRHHMSTTIKSGAVSMATVDDGSNTSVGMSRESIIATTTACNTLLRSIHVPLNNTGTKTTTLASRLKELKESYKCNSKRQNEVKVRQTAKRQQKLLAFTVPFKKQAKKCSDDNMPSKPSLVAVEELSNSERQQLEDNLHCAEEVAMALMYNDGSSQLRELIDNKRRSTLTEFKAVSLAIAYPVTINATRMQYVTFSLPDKSKTGLNTTGVIGWKRSVINNLMKSSTRKLVFDGQELIECIMLSFTFDSKQVISWNVLDVKIAGWLLDPDNPPVTFTDVLSKSFKENMTSPSFNQVERDLDRLGPVMSYLYHQLNCNDLWILYTKVEMPLVPILACMQQRGIHIDANSMIESGNWMQKKLTLLEKEVFQAAGHSFIINSHPQLRQVLFEELKLDTKLPQRHKIARTASNLHKSTSETVLKQLASVHSLPGLILKYRQIQKIKSTYIDGMLSYIKDGVLYTHWDHTAAVTGRVTSVNPNIQAIPKQPVIIDGVRDKFVLGKDDIPVTIHPRQPFVAKPGCSFLTADFQQIELRLLADMSKDVNLMAAFTNTDNADIFIQLASQWLGKPLTEVSTSDREQTKRVVYSVMYGAGKDRLAEYLDISTNNAKAIITSFLGKFPEISNFTKKCISEARCKGYQSTILGRRRWFPQINHHNAALRSQAERQAVNFCIQGSAADLCKMAMIKVEHCLANKEHLNARLVIQIHDELLLELPDEEITEVTGMLRDIMEKGNLLRDSKYMLRVPVRVNFNVGKSWANMTSCK